MELEAAYTIDFARRHQHVQKAGDVAAVGEDRVFNRARHGAQRSLVQDVIDVGTGRAAGVQIADIATHHVETAPLRGGDALLHLIQVALATGGKIIQADHALIELEQRLQQIGADETGHAGDKPGVRG